LIGQNQEQYRSAIRQAIAPLLIAYGLLAALFIGFLSTLGTQVIKPILELGKAADNISRGKKISIVGYSTKEFNILSKQLSIISKINRSLKYKQHRLAFMNEKLANANEFIKSNVAFLNHELINPVSSILGFSGILHKKLNTINDPEIKDSIDMIYKAAQHQNTQLKFFLKLFKFQEAKRKIEEKSINLKQLVLWNLSMIIHHIKTKNIKVITNIPEDLTLLGDEIMLGQLIQNLASNAAKYNKFNGQLEITACINKAGGIEISFIDSGIGIEKKELKNIFKMFSRASNIKDKVIGYGIGLTYAKQCIDLHNAKIEVSSKILEGSIFKVIFPKERTK
jgi:signal transduction histidine kinase